MLKFKANLTFKGNIMKDKEKGKKIRNIILFIVAIALLSVALFFALKALGVTDRESLQAIIEKCGIWGNIVFVLLFIVVTVLLCFVPATTATFLVVGALIFPPWEAFILCTISVFISSSLMFWVGDKLGERAVIKLVGKETLEKAQNLIDVKSKLFLPLMFLFPAFPDDALCMVAGMTKMKYWYFASIVAVCRTVGVATFVFLGSGILPFDELNIIEWFMLINIIIFDVVLIFKYSDKLEKMIYRKRKEEKGEVATLPMVNCNTPVEAEVSNVSEADSQNSKSAENAVASNSMENASSNQNATSGQEEK